MCNIEEDLLCPHHDLSIFKILHQREKESYVFSKHYFNSVAFDAC